ncbi:asparagine synthase-related protein [Octadecabacter sp. G9-8]|uniref:asparagine synthase (glutamine-hydrolyzing) n=1 Tax=Octadecabacter dasysiphoniae TaxID=2909341 RepID=A0ABS9D147_9RHOB|nr:asparagine synthase-related protein [Octadecabacter dasysiphoniae]MCF2872355.1 asparagine synthase-related protein [Octadecabacter dasysiphoniae]
MFACIMARGTRQAPQTYATEQDLLDALTPYDQADVQGAWSNDQMLMVQTVTWNTPQSRHETAPQTCPKTGRVIVSWSRLDNRAQLCSALGLTDSDTLTDPQIILAGFDMWDDACADRFEGDFSFVIYDPQTSRTFCARDSIGARPFFYYVDADVFVCASTPVVFTGMKALKITPSRAWMARHMADAPHDMTHSAFEGVARLAPAHSMRVTREGPVEPQPYFEFKDTAPAATHRDPQYLEDYRAAFHTATEARLRSDFRVGSESSGGLDSSSIIGHAVKHLPHDIDDFHCFGMSHFEQEPEYLLETAMHCGVRHNHITTHARLHDDPSVLERTLKVMGYPAEHDQAHWHIDILRQCQQLGIRTLLSGYGGDEMVTHQAAALHTELFHKRNFGVLAREMHGNAVTRWARFALNLRRLSAKTKGNGAVQPIPKFVRAYVDNALLRQDAIEEFQVTQRFASWYAHQAKALTLNEHILRGPDLSPRRVARLEACALLAQSYGVEYRWPLYDRQLMLQFLKTPAIEKRRKKMGRYLHRRAATGTIPDKVTWKQSKDLGGVTVGLVGRELPKDGFQNGAHPVLSTVLDPAKMGAKRAEYEQAKSGDTVDEIAVAQYNSFWRANALVRWLA